MTLVIGGAVSAILGLIGLIFWWSEFFAIVKGGAPIIMLLGGILAVYVGVDDIQEKLREERQSQEESLEKAREEIEIVKAKAEQYREELDKLKEETHRKQ
ncbi:MAG: hypothetical protein JW950_03030 [Deltaproteobacteria bacterium]|nr:hypothetical protein [Deltaproteobacteria bacterium]